MIDTKNLRALAYSLNIPQIPSKADQHAASKGLHDLLDALERKDKAMRDLIAALKLDRHDTDDWPADSRIAIEAITKELI